MAQSELGGGRLFALYARYVGEPQSRKDVYGYWTMVIGFVIGLSGVAMFVVAPSERVSEFLIREISISIAAVGLPIGLLGIVLMLPVRRRGIQVAIVGTIVTFAAVAWFTVVYPRGWISPTGARTIIIGLYGGGVAIVAGTAALVPVVTGEQSLFFEQESTADRDHPAVMVGEEKRGALFSVFDGDGSTWRWWLIEQEALAGGIETYLSHLETEEAVDRVKEAVRRARLLEIRNAAFRLYESDEEGYRWQLMRESGDAIAESPGAFESREAVENSVSLLKEHGPEADIIEVQGAAFDLDTERGGWLWRLVDEQHRELGHSRPAYDSMAEAEAGISRVRESVADAGVLTIDTFGIELYDEDGEWRWRLLDEEDARLATSAASWSSRRDVEGAVYDVLGEVGSAPVIESGEPGYEVYDDDDAWRWRFVNGDGVVTAEAADAAVDPTTAETGAERVRDSLGDADVAVAEDSAFEIYPEDDAWRWRLVTEDRTVLSRSATDFEDRESAEAALGTLRDQALAADLIEFENAAFQLYETGGEWRWRLIDEDGNVMTDSGENYASRDAASSAMGTLKRNAPDAELIEIETAAFELYEEDGTWEWRLVDEAGREIAECGAGHPSREAAREAMDTFVRQTEGTPERTMSRVTFQLHPADDEWRWRLVHPDGTVLAVNARAYATRDEAGSAIEDLRPEAAGAPVHTVGRLAIQLLPGDEVWRWRLIDADREPVATSATTFDTREAVVDAVETIRTRLPDATVFDLEQLAFRLEPAGDGWIWRLIDEDRAEIARSAATFEDRDAAERAMEQVRSLAADADLIDFEQAAFEFVETEDGWNWRLIDESKSIIARGAHSAAARDDVERRLEAVRDLVADASILEIETAAFELSEEDGEWRWRLVDEEGDTLGRSILAYPTREDAREVITTVKEMAPNAMTTVRE